MGLFSLEIRASLYCSAKSCEKISGFDIKILKDYSDDFCHPMTEKAAKMAALDGEIADRDEQKSGQGLYYCCEQQKLCFLWRVILNNCSNANQAQ